jgi:hypothetical protein
VPTTLGEAFVRVRPNTAGFEQEASGKLGGAFKRVAGLAAAAFASAKVGTFLKDSITQASNLAEAANVVNLTFKDSAGSLDKFFATAATSIGMSGAAARQAAANIGGLLNNMGFTREESAKTSKSVLTLGADLGSAFNADPARAVEAIGAALRGETEPIRAFNVSVSDATVKAKALEMGLYSGKGAIDVNAKAQATLALIMQQTADVQGDFANTSDGLANKQRIAAARSLELKQAVGDVLLPAQLALTTVWADRFLPALTEFAERKGPAVAAWSEKIGVGLKGVFDILVNGDFTSEFGKAFNISDDSDLVFWLFRVRSGVQGIYDLIVKGDFTAQFGRAFNLQEDSKTVDVLFRIRDAVTQAGDKVREFFSAAKSGDRDALRASFSSIFDSVEKLIPVVQEFIRQMPGVTDLLQVTAVVLRFAADNADLLAAAIPFVVTGFLLLKGAQIAANAAATVAVPLRIAELVTQRRLAASNAQLAASFVATMGATTANTGATVANTVATGTATGATIRQRIAQIASAVATRAVAAATVTWTGVQWLLNAALSANPIGIVIALVAGLAAGIIYAYKNSETFRNIVNGAFKAVAEGGRQMWEGVLKPVFRFLVQTWLSVADAILRGAETAFGWVPGVGDKLRDARRQFDVFRDGVNRALSGINDKTVTVTAKLGLSQRDVPLAYRAGNQRLAVGGKVRGFGGPTQDNVPIWASAGEHMWTVREVESVGGHAAMARMRKAAKAGAFKGYADGGPVGFDLRADPHSPAAFAASMRSFDAAMARAATDVGTKAAKAVEKAYAASTTAGGGAAFAGTGRSGNVAFTRSVQAAVRSAFPGTNNGGDLGLGRAGRSKHNQGKALDIFPGTRLGEYARGADLAMGNRIVRFLANQRWNTDNIIWQREIYNRRGRRPYTRYGSNPGATLGHYDHVHWDSYDDGGTLPPRSATLAINRTSHSERIRSGDQEDRIVAAIRDLRSGESGGSLVGEYHYHDHTGAGAGPGLDELTHRVRVLRRGGVTRR